MHRNGFVLLLDGYNIIKRKDEYFSKDLRGNRDILRNIACSVRMPFPVKKIIIVYDAVNQQPYMENVFSNALVKEVYAKNTADTYIRKYVKTDNAPEKLVVVSDDKEILGTAKSFCAGCMSVDTFLTRALEGEGKKRKSGYSPNKNKRVLSRRQENEIEIELKEVWGIS